MRIKQFSLQQIIVDRSRSCNAQYIVRSRVLVSQRIDNALTISSTDSKVPTVAVIEIKAFGLSRKRW